MPFLLFSGCAVQEPAPIQPLVFLLLGQSNMLGLGQDADFPPVPGVTMTGVNAPFRGPGPAFAQAVLAAYPGHTIHLVQYAISGSPMSHWTPSLGDWSGEPGLHPGETIAGVLFSQGESEGTNPVQVPWAQMFTQMVTVIRHDLNNPALPVIFAQIGYDPNLFVPSPNIDTSNWQYVKDQQASIDLPNVVMVETDDLTKNSPEHFPASSYAVVGERMAQAYIRLGYL